MARCPVTKKVRFLGREHAIDTAARLAANEQDLGPRPLNVYLCKDCGDWHIGHRPKRLKAPSELLARPVRVVAPRCECHCKKAAQETVTTPHGTFHCCPKHARKLRTMWNVPAPEVSA